MASDAASFVVERLSRGGIRTGQVVDLGAGSGIFSRRLAGAGFDVVAVEQSDAMLDIAKPLAPKAEFIQASIWDVRLPPAVAIAAIGEIVCYLFDDRAGLDHLARLAGEAFDSLSPGGVFVFDVATPGRAWPAPIERFYESDAWSLFMRAEEDVRTRTLTRTITSLTREGEHYRRHRETHALRLFKPEEIERILEGIGFSVESRDGYGEFCIPRGWKVFVATKTRRGET